MLTVLLATRNGSQTLPNTLEAFTRLDAPSSGWKLVVIDNGSTDGTREIIKSFRTRLLLTYTYEAQPGRNAALNTGLAHVEGDLVVITDDDIYPHQDWLIRLRAAADERRDYLMFGGAIIPCWQVTPPDWLKWVDQRVAFAKTDFADGPIHLGFLFGGNLAIRADVFRCGARFNTSIGPCGKSYAMGSETELLMRLGREGHKGWHVRNAVVEHFVWDYQMTQSWVLDRAIRFGRGRFRISKAAGGPPVWCWRGMPLELLLRLAKKAAKRVIARLRFSEHAVFMARWEFNYLFGQLIEARLMRQEERAQVQGSPGSRCDHEIGM